jgi:hypothetical protein
MFGKESANEPEEIGAVSGEFDNPELASALRNFRQSVHAWSDAAYTMKRAAVTPATHRVAWSKSIVWVVSLALSVGLLSIGVHERHQQQLQAAIVHQREMDRQRLLDEQRARQAQEELAQFDTELAKVDRDIAREVPAAMDPLAHLMEDDGGK